MFGDVTRLISYLNSIDNYQYKISCPPIIPNPDEYKKWYDRLDDRSTTTNNTKAKTSKKINRHCIPDIKYVKFNPPATIVFWSDNTKTVVKDEDIKKVYLVPDDYTTDEFSSIQYMNNNFQTKSVNYMKWKELGLLNAMIKKVFPDFNNILDKWCK